MTAETPKMYGELAPWWHLLSAPEDYLTEAEFFHELLDRVGQSPPHTVLEIGSGGGNNAWHLKAYYHLTLVDLSPDMLAASRTLNPECEHLEGDMRTLRLGREFDAVFIHDAICYMTSEFDLRRALETAFVHCRPGGVAVFVPDDIRETFEPETEHGGHDAPGVLHDRAEDVMPSAGRHEDSSVLHPVDAGRFGHRAEDVRPSAGGHDDERRGIRYMEWSYDPDETDTLSTTDYVYLLREGADTVRVVYDRHIHGLFSWSDWMRLVEDAGFQPGVVMDSYGRNVFYGVKPR